MLVVIIGFCGLLFWKLIWKVWSEALNAKDEEIARLARERDRYQALVFERLLTSEVMRPKAGKTEQIERKSGELH
jgi:hypothetical protein